MARKRRLTHHMFRERTRGRSAHRASPGTVHHLTAFERPAPPAPPPAVPQTLDQADWLSADDATFDSCFPIGVRPSAHLLNRRVVRALRGVLQKVPSDADLAVKPLELDLLLPLPPRLRIYAFMATQHASERQPDTYKVQLTHVSRTPEGMRWKFSRADGARPVLLGFAAALDLFILWDADVNDAGEGFTYSKSIQAPPEVVYGALAHGIATDTRRVRAVGEERIVAVRRSRLAEGLLRRIELSNGTLIGQPDAE